MRRFGDATYTCATLEVSAAAFDEIEKKFKDAGYDHVFAEGGIDMTHIMIVRAKPDESETSTGGTMSVQENVVRTIANVLGLEDSELNFSDQQDFRTALKMDSLDLVELAMALEDDFNIVVPDKEFMDARTIYDLTNLVLFELDRR